MRRVTLSRRQRALQQRGAILVMALVSLLVATSLVGTLLHGTLQSRRQMLVEHHVRQAELLLDAACRRAAYQLTANADYQGETWQLAEGLVKGAQAESTISVANDSIAEDQAADNGATDNGAADNGANGRKFTVTVQYTFAKSERNLSDDNVTKRPLRGRLIRRSRTIQLPTNTSSNREQ